MKVILLIALLGMATIGCDTPQSSTGNPPPAIDNGTGTDNPSGTPAPSAPENTPTTPTTPTTPSTPSSPEPSTPSTPGTTPSGPNSSAGGNNINR